MSKLHISDLVLMIKYTIRNHVPGRISIEMSSLRQMTIQALNAIADEVINICGIKGMLDFGANPLTRSVTIQYDPNLLDISTYLSDLTSNERIETLIMKGALYEMH